jgi:IS30 family transposase
MKIFDKSTPQPYADELDTMVSSRRKSKGCVATFIERKTRLNTAILMPDRTVLSMEIALGVAISQYSKGTFLTATADRGKEFAMPMWKRLIT